MKIVIPAGGWRPRDYQMPAWKGLHTHNHAELICHRRWGKDDICLHGAMVKMLERPATYWHMLPQANQVRRAIWEAVNPHTGRRRIDEAFPHELRETTREQDMMIKFKNGSTWQALGSDNYEGSIGSPPAGIVFSEWPQAKPNARAYLRPILAENKGWQWYIGTPRGKNHGYKTFNAALKDPKVYALRQTVDETGVFTPDQLQTELQALVDEWGEDIGQALFDQEYYCSFDAAILGAYYQKETRNVEQSGRYGEVPHTPGFPVYCAMDIGWNDDTSIWWFQVIGGTPRIIDFYTNHNKSPDEIASEILGRKIDIDFISGQIVVRAGDFWKGAEHRAKYEYADGGICIPHDALAKTFTAKGKSLQEQFAKVFGASKLRKVPNLSVQDGIQAGRLLLKTCLVDEEKCSEGWEALKSYRRKWNENKQAFDDSPFHDWASHPSDAWRYMALVWAAPKMADKTPQALPDNLHGVTMSQLINQAKSDRRRRI